MGVCVRLLDSLCHARTVAVAAVAALLLSVCRVVVGVGDGGDDDDDNSVDGSLPGGLSSSQCCVVCGDNAGV